MGKISYWLALLCFPLLLQGQITFNKRLNFGFPASILTSVVPTDSCYYATGIIADSLPPYLPGNIFVKFGLDGNPEWFKTLVSTEKTYETWFNTLTPMPDGNFYVSGFSYDSLSKALMIKFDAYGDTIFVREYPNPFSPEYDYIHPRAFCQTKDGGFVFACQIRTSNAPNNDIWVVKTDSDGAVLWDKIYGDVAWDVPNSMIVDEQNNIIVGAVRNNINFANENYFYQTHIFQIDSIGNLQWSYLTSPSTMLRDAANDMVLLDDGSLVIASGDGTEFERPSINVVWFDKLIFKLNPDHDLEWQVTFKEPEISGLAFTSVLIEISDGSGFLTAGTSYLETGPNYTVMGWLGKIAPDGDSIWTRDLVFLETAKNQHEIFDLKETPDGGFILCGQAKETSGADTIPQQAWLIKVDEWGCLVPGCQTPATEIFDNKFIRLAIYPNPTAEYLNFYFHSPVFNKNKGSFSVLDANGRIIREFATDRNDATFILPVHDWPVGVYFLQYREDGQVLTAERFVVQR